MSSMTGKSRFALLAAAWLLALPALAQNLVVINKTLVGSSAHKECVNLTDQQLVRYWYRSEAPIDFNIQYVDGKETLYPVKRDQQAMGSGSYAPKAAQVTCMVWTNTGKRPILFRVEFARLVR